MNSKMYTQNFLDRLQRYNLTIQENDQEVVSALGQSMVQEQHLVLLLAAACLCCQAIAMNEVPACDGKSIYIMDLGMFASEHKIPPCSYTVCSCQHCHPTFEISSLGC